jgi:hypothetical protein
MCGSSSNHFKTLLTGVPKCLKLSAFATQVLSERKLIDINELELHSSSK